MEQIMQWLLLALGGAAGVGIALAVLLHVRNMGRQ